MPKQMTPIPRAFLTGGVRMSTALRAGLTREELDGPLWSRPHHGVRLWAGEDHSAPQRVAAAAALLPPGAAVGGWAAGLLLGVSYLDGEALDGRLSDVPLVIPPPRNIRKRPGIVLWRAPLEARDLVVVDGVPVTSPQRTGFDLARHSTLVEAVVALDAMLRGQVVSATETLAYIEAHGGWKGAPRARAALRRADPGAESPMESRLRVRQVLAGLPCPLVNPSLWDHNGMFLGRPDLFEPESALAQEYDGGVHADAQRRAEDAARQEGLERAGVLVVRFGSVDIGLQWDRTLRRIRAARRDGLRRNRRRDRWQLTALPRHLDWLADLPTGA